MKTFLKVLTLMVVLAWATGICAQDVTARAEIRVSSPTGSSDVLQLLEISSATADFDNGWDSEKILDNTTFSIYALAGGTPVSTYATNDLNNTALVFQTSEEKANYEFSFLIKVTGTQLYLYDAEEDLRTPIAEDRTYSFTCPTSGTFNDRFVIYSGTDPTPQEELTEYWYWKGYVDGADTMNEEDGGIFRGGISGIEVRDAAYLFVVHQVVGKVGEQYLAEAYSTETHTTLTTSGTEKLYIPAGSHTLYLYDNGDGTVELSREPLEGKTLMEGTDVPTDTIPPVQNDSIEPTVSIFGIDVPVDPSGSGEDIDILNDSTLLYNPEENTLTFNNLTLVVGEDEGTAISYSGEEPLTIVLNDESAIIADTVIASTGDIIITGTGTLVLEGTVPLIGVPEASITFESNLHAKSLPSAAAVRRRIKGIKRAKDLDETGGPALSGFGSADFNKVNVSPSDAMYGSVNTTDGNGEETTINALYVQNSDGSQEVVTEFKLTAKNEDAVENTRTKQAFDPKEPMYNILGLPVQNGYKGLIIQNGQIYLIQ